MTWSAPSARARSSFASLDEVMIARAPAIFAICSAKIETPPVPSESTVSPAFNTRGPCISAFQTVTPAHGSVAACSYDKCGGNFSRPSAWNTQYSASVPSSGRPSASGGLPCVNVATTRSPALNCVTPAPTAATSPAPSDSGTVSCVTGPRKYLPATIARSRKFSDAARMRTRTWPALGLGRSRLASLSPSNPVEPLATRKTFMRVLRLMLPTLAASPRADNSSARHFEEAADALGDGSLGAFQMEMMAARNAVDLDVREPARHLAVERAIDERALFREQQQNRSRDAAC